MAKNPAFQFYASDWLGSNARVQMTLEQQGAYINLLCRQWSDPTCSLPDDDEALSRLSEMGKGWFNDGCQLVRDCFPPHPTLVDRIANEKLLKLRAERDEWTEKSREGGRKSGEAKRKRRVKGGSTTVPTKRQPNANTPSPSPSPSVKDPLKSPKGDGAFDAFWASVHLKTGKDAARRAHIKAVKRVGAERGIPPREAAAYILERMQAFSGTPRANPPDRTAIHPKTWLNQGCYNDDPSTWGGPTSEPAINPSDFR